MRTKRKTVIWICQPSGSNCCLEKWNQHPWTWRQQWGH